jgi:DNA segregation ATPase FtsK/SpoIIIE, S-DNA-T family
VDKLSYDNPFEADRLGSAASFSLDWDVPEINEHVSTDVGKALDAIHTRDGTDDRAKVRVLLGAPGHGKTHLFGRVRHTQQGKLFFVYVPQLLDTRRPAEHARWHLTEALFAAEPGQHPPLTTFLAALLAPSFKSYFDGLPASFAARHQALRQRLGADPLAVLDLLAPTKDLLPFHKLADSVATQFPALPADILRGLVLGLSPAGHDARCWLRGDALSEPKLADLRIKATPPEARNFLLCVAVLLQRLRLPVLVCFDQFEAVLKDEQGPKAITTEVMAWLDSIPNLLVVMSCLDGEWRELRERGFSSFLDRAVECTLNRVSPSQAVDLVRRRLKSWAEYQSERGATWPFDAAAIERFVQKNLPSARGFVQSCSVAFSRWLDERPAAPIDLTATNERPRTLEEVFVGFWNQELLAVQQAKPSPDNQQEDWLFKNVHEALKVAQEGKLIIDGAQLLGMQSGALRPSPTDARPSLELRLGVEKEAFGVVVAVTRNDSGGRFGAYLEALESATGKQVAGSVLVRPTSTLKVGAGTKAAKKYHRAVNANKLRPFPLDEEVSSYAQLECLGRVIQKAEAGDLQLAGTTLKPAQCRQLFIKLKLLDNLKLFEVVFAGWPATEGARKAAGACAAATVATGAATPTDPKLRAGTPSRGDSGLPPAGSESPLADAPTDPQVWGQAMLDRLVELLHNCKQPVTDQGVEIGPAFARLKVTPKGQTDVNKIRRKAENIQLGLGLSHRPVVGTQAGYISVDVQRPDRQTVTLREALADEPPGLRDQPAFPVGMDVSGHTHWLNFADPATCHLLIAGTTGSGKSEFMKALLASLAHRLGPDQIQFVLIDPKQVTFNLPGNSPYLRAPIAYDLAAALPLIEECFTEMERRYTLLRERRLENVAELTGAEAPEQIVVLFDEFADLMLEKESKKGLETLLKRLGAKARAAGIHLVLGTQRTEASVVTPLLRSNLPGRVSLRVMGERDSKLIVDAPDAAHLLGRGDLLWWQGGGLLRLQSPFVARDQLESCLRVESNGAEQVRRS